MPRKRFITRFRVQVRVMCEYGTKCELNACLFNIFFMLILLVIVYGGVGKPFKPLTRIFQNMR